MSFRINTHLTATQIALLPVYTPFALRHLRKPNILNKIVGAIELVPGISLIASIIELIVQRCLRRVSNAGGENMAIVANKKIFMQHLTGSHPETPQRVEAIENALRAANLMNKNNTIEPRKASESEIRLCHSSGYVEMLKKQVSSLPAGDSIGFDTTHWKHPNISGDFKISKETYNTSLYAAGAPLAAIDYILDTKNKTSRAFCIVRPPGHHAHQQTGSGFCVFNNVAIAAKYLAKKNYKVAIVDWDAHHGEGTQELTETDKKIYYFSTHKDTASGFYPYPPWGAADQTGKYHNVMNCPVSGSSQSCREGILAAFKKLEGAMDTFRPDFVLISCGFDAHENDSLVGLGLRDEDYKTMTESCIRIANKYSKGRIVSVLEGGYDLDSISVAAEVHVETLRQ